MKRFFLAIFALGIALSAFASPARANVTARFVNMTNNCVWMTGYQHGSGIVWQIIWHGNVLPGHSAKFETYGDAKLRTEVYESAACSGKQIKDLELVTGAHNAWIRLTKGRTDFQLERY